MSYNGAGFYNKRSGTWVSGDHARQHVGETLGGWEKRRSASTGNFYMAKSSGSGADYLSMFIPGFGELLAFDMLMDVLNPNRAAAKKELQELAENIAFILTVCNECAAVYDIKLGGHEDERIYTAEGIKHIKDASRFAPYAPDLNEIMTMIHNSVAFGINFNPELTLYNAKEMMKQCINRAVYVAKKLAWQTGRHSFSFMKDKAYDALLPVYEKYGVDVPQRNEPFFWEARKSTSFSTGSDIPAGEYWIERIDEESWIKVELIDRSGCAIQRHHINGLGCYVTVCNGQTLEVRNGKFALASLLPVEIASEVDAGMWKVGVDILPGDYVITKTEGHAYYKVQDDSSMLEGSKFYWCWEGDSITLFEGEYFLLCNAHVARIEPETEGGAVDLSKLSKQELLDLKNALEQLGL